MTVRFVPDVEPGPVSPQISLVLPVIAGAPFAGVAWITALDNGEHMEGSKHDPSQDTGWKVAALDLDALDTTKNQRLRSYLSQYLPNSYDVILEDQGGPNEHVHVESDPEA